MEPIEAGLTSPAGFRVAGVHCGIKADTEALDLGIIVADQPAAVAATFTTNKVHAAPVRLSRERVALGRAQAVVVNSGNANACTGDRGFEDAQATSRLTARLLDIREGDVLVASTGKIGERLPMEKIEAGITEAVGALARGGDADRAIARAIMTTDRISKSAAAGFQVNGQSATLAGIAKGAGMIAPNMATMLCFLTVDVAIDWHVLRDLLADAVNTSFNRISVDGHTSTNDTVICLASGALGNDLINRGSRPYRELRAALGHVTSELARMIVRDGEGMTKFVEIVVRGAASDADALKVARAVADSPMVKTSIYGEDPNWGRFTSAAGYSGARLDEAKLSCWIGDVLVFGDGEPVAGVRDAAHEQITGSEVRITLDLGLGSAGTTVWATDLTEDYVRLNAQYS